MSGGITSTRDTIRQGFGKPPLPLFTQGTILSFSGETQVKKGEQLSKMLVLATNAHAGQFDKGGKPYILHPLKVMHYLRSEEEELQCIALGYDVIEDTDVTFAQLRQEGFSDRVIEGIRCLTKQRGETYEEYKEKVFSNKDAMRVKMADLRHNTDIRRLKYYTFYLEIMAKMDV